VNDPLNQTTQTATGLCAGTYVIVVTDSTGCTYTDSVTINNLININVNADTIKVSCNGTVTDKLLLMQLEEHRLILMFGILVDKQDQRQLACVPELTLLLLQT
jgi:hypothetical protein